MLITSYTSKALNVLKEKVPEGIQSLCVSVLDDSNADMEKSVDGFEESFTSSLGASKANVEGKVKWVSDEILELTISLDGLTPEDLDIDLDDGDSVIEAVVKELEDTADMKLKEVK